MGATLETNGIGISSFTCIKYLSSNFKDDSDNMVYLNKILQTSDKSPSTLWRVNFNFDI